jgi:hypothetical protein
VANVLPVSTLQIGDPVAPLVLMETDNLSFHGSFTLAER